MTEVIFILRLSTCMQGGVVKKDGTKMHGQDSSKMQGDVGHGLNNECHETNSPPINFDKDLLWCYVIDKRCLLVHK